MMKARVQRWGNSLAIRIPRAMASELGVSNHSLVEMSLSSHRLIVEPCADDGPSLDVLVSRITDENRHDEVSWGASVGAEIS